MKEENNANIDILGFVKNNLFQILVIIITSTVAFSLLRAETDANKTQIQAQHEQILSILEELDSNKDDINTNNTDIAVVNAKLDLLLKKFDLQYIGTSNSNSGDTKGITDTRD